MITLNSLKNSNREHKNRKRVGRGMGSKCGKTCGRGEKGMGSRSGAKLRLGKEGGNMPRFMKIPIRGFSNFRFRTEFDVINLDQINNVYKDGDVVNSHSMIDKGLITASSPGVKLLGNGELTKKVTIELDAISETAREKLAQAKIKFTLINEK